MGKRIFNWGNVLLLIIFANLYFGCSSENKKNLHTEHLMNSLTRIDQMLPSKNPEIGIKEINQIRLEAVENNLQQVIGRSEISLAYIYQQLGDNENLLSHALEANKLLKKKSLHEKVIYAESLRLIAEGYYQSEHYLEALHYTKKALRTLSNTEKIKNSSIIRGLIHDLQFKISKSMADPYNQLYNLKKSLSYFQNQKNSPWYYHLMGNTYNNFASYFIYTEKQLDSALVYIEKSLKASQKINHANAIGKSYLHLGDIHFLKKDPLKALHYYKKSEIIFDSLHKPVEKATSYFNIVKTYDVLKDDILKNHYKIKYLELKDSTEKAKKSLRYLVNQTINKQNKNSILKSKKELILYFLLGFLVLKFSLYIIWKKVQHKNKSKIEEYNKRIVEKRQVIESVKLKVDQLKNEIFLLKSQNIDELQESIKKEDKFFLAKFEEIYPNFISNLKQEHKNLSVSDLKFCALVKLNFSTKEIADINYVTTKAIEIKRYRIRKKLNLPSKINFEKWIQTL